FLGQSLDRFATDDDVYLVHRDSIVDAGAFASYADRTCDLVRDAACRDGGPRCLTNLESAYVERLEPSALAELTTSDDVVAGFRTPERSVSTVPIADLLSDAVHSEPRIEVRTATWIHGVRRRADGRLDVVTARDHGDHLEGFDVVVNALWEGRLA